jgi:hypothetical protein
MKKKIVVTAIALALLQMTGCSSTKIDSGIMPGSSATTAISEQRVATNEFKRQGIKIYYTLTGGLEAIEATGYAPVWGNSENALRESFRVAELEAKKSLNDFINRENITSSTSVKMISNNLEQAKDNKKNNFVSNIVKSTDQFAEVESAVGAAKELAEKAGHQGDTNTAVRNDALKIASTVNNEITVKASGILGGLYLTEGKVINSGKNVMATYRWDARSNAARPTVRSAMMQ